jgi:site-specific DNA-methyltransferase (adenine-specific)
VRKEVIGDATLYNGDCCEVLESIASDSIKLLWTDPPYGNSNHSGDFNASLNKHRGLESQPILNDDLASMKNVVNKMLIQAARIIQGEGCCCCCVGGGGPSPVFAWLAERMDRDGLQFFHSFIWDKKNPGIGWRFRRQHEMIMIAHRAGGKLAWADDNIQVPNIFSLMPPREREHPNEKPLMLMESFIHWHTKTNDVVCDPFMGSGSTGVAALKNGRKFIGIELDPKHFDTAVRRITDAASQGGGLFNL